MKKFIMLALILVLTFSLCACGRSGNEDTTASTGATTTAPTILPMPSTNATLDTQTQPTTTVPSTTDNTTGTEGTDNTTGNGTNGTTNGSSAQGNMPVG